MFGIAVYIPNMLNIYIAEDLTQDLLARDERILSKVMHFEAHCGIDIPLTTTYTVYGSELVSRPYSVENAPPSDLTHPLWITLGADADDVHVRYGNNEIPLLTELHIVLTAEPRTRLIRLVALNMSDALRAQLVALKGVEVIIDHAARATLTSVTEETFP